MVDKGARHIVLVSRSGSNAKVQELMNEMEAYDARIVVEKCDVGDKLDVAALTERIRIEMPPMKGLIHSAMVLHVCQCGLLTRHLLTLIGYTFREPSVRPISVCDPAKSSWGMEPASQPFGIIS